MNVRMRTSMSYLSHPFTWIAVTSVAKSTNLEQQVKSTIGRMGHKCNTYKNTEMIVLGGEVRDGYDSVTRGQCSTLYAPVRVLDLSTYHWQTSLDMNPSYSVPEAIYNVIGGEYVHQYLMLIVPRAD